MASLKFDIETSAEFRRVRDKLDRLSGDGVTNDHGSVRIKSVNAGRGGTKSSDPGPLVFPVTVTQTGGSNGTQSTAASYTYDVKDMDGNSLGTGVALARPRPNGTVTAGSTYGMAFYQAGVLKLWDAGEIPGSGHC